MQRGGAQAGVDEIREPASPRGRARIAAAVAAQERDEPAEGGGGRGLAAVPVRGRPPLRSHLPRRAPTVSAVLRCRGVRCLHDVAALAPYRHLYISKYLGSVVVWGFRFVV